MNQRMTGLLAAALAVSASQVALAQAPAPNFAPPNTSAQGVRAIAATCAMCHGTQGQVVAGSSVVGLAGLPRDEMIRAMAQFKAGQRPATIMHQIAKGYGDGEIAALADYFSAQRRQGAQ